MVEDRKALSEVSDISALNGVDLVALGPTDLSQTLRVNEPNDPKIVAEVLRISKIVKESGNTKLQIPMNHPAYPLNAAELVELGVGYTNVAPQPPAILLREMTNAIKNTHNVLGRKY
jgi:2-keto-3-deoxy-L-rhamnonate aldolase RhmA